DKVQALAVDNSGNVYVTGYSVGSGTSYDYATVKYNSQGEEQWVARYNGPGNSEDKVQALAVDNSGNVYVTGRSYGSETYDDYATIKYNSQGKEQWVARYNGPGNYFDEAYALAVDNSGNVYVTGYSYGSGTSYDYATVKYNSQGEEHWVARYNGQTNSNDRAYALAIDNSGNVYVTGYSFSGKSSIYTTIKYSSDGADIVESTSNTPVSYFLSQNYPNPFNPTTTIEYQLPKASKVTMKVYDILGREVATLVDDEIKAGYHTATFDGSRYASGIYFVQMTAQSNSAKPYVKIMKIVLMK
ncbi:MAG TPA: SBBP repeat-containing protein, partial [Bacteroidota bacterium]|nr:SBBP repeat-containing protein [Bacteroidota bacterium]